MSLFSNIKAKLTSRRAKTKAIAASFIVALASVTALVTFSGASAAPVSTPNCDANSVIWCGASSVSKLQTSYSKADGHNSATSIHNIYSAFGISSSDISAMSTTAVKGYVTKSGDVYAGSTLVATGAVTAGRQNISGSTKTTYGGTTFYERKPSVSFLDNELSAMVSMKNGVFQFAILNSCGNPVKATPKKPAVSVVKQVRAGTSGSYGSSVSVKSGSTVSYQITASSTGAVPALDVIVKDALPAGITYTAGTLAYNGKAETAADASKFFSTGINVGTLKNGTKGTFTFTAKAGTVMDTDDSCKAATINNTGTITSTGLPTQTSGAKVSTICTPKPNLACNLLTAAPGAIDSKTGNQTYSFTAKGTATNTSITGYAFDFGDSKTATTTGATTTHTYVPGTYTATVTVKAGALSATAETCKVSITVKPPLKPNYALNKQVSTTANGTYGNDVTVKSGATAYYKITVASTGDTPATNVLVRDAMPADLNYTSGTLKQDGLVLTNTDAADLFGKGLVLTSIKNGTSVVFTYQATAGNTKTDTDPSCKAETLNNTGYISSTGLDNQQSGATTKTTCTVLKGNLACTGLTAALGDTDTTSGVASYTFTGTATATNATIKTYSFVVTDTATNKVVATVPVSTSALTATTASATKLNPGSYSVVLTVTGTDNYGATVTAPASSACSAAIKVPTPECKPGVTMGSSSCYTYSCNAFTLTIASDTRTVTVASFDASSTNPNATLSHVVIDWGDSSAADTTGPSPIGENHTFTVDSSTVTATAQFTTPDSTTPVSSTVCTQPVSFTITPPAETPPTELPNTGAGNVIAIFFGAIVAGTLATRLMIARKLGRQ
jgi:uncharacterized repeat protein (TIGR01451 family)